MTRTVCFLSPQTHSSYENNKNKNKKSFNENHLDEPQDTEFKRTIIKVIKEFQEFKERSKQNNQHKMDKNKHMSDSQEKINI